MLRKEDLFMGVQGIVENYNESLEQWNLFITWSADPLEVK